MQRIFVNSSIQPYTIYIGKDIRFQMKDLIQKDYSSILIITDSHVAELYCHDIVTSLPHEKVFVEVVEAGEKAKSLETFYYLHTRAIGYGLDRESLIIALGGGVIGDLAGFVAATFMRGVDYAQVPTTILAHDSSIGGKVAINHEKGKNLIGSFYPPVFVLYDTGTLKTLSAREIRSGFAEIVKETMLADEDLFTQILSTSLDRVTLEQLSNYIYSGITIKAKIVQDDEKESGKRKLLNLGHTLGHALEAKLGYGVLTHGEAVACGLLFAMFVSEKELQANLPRAELRKWLEENGYDFPMEADMVDDLIELIKHDKKVMKQDVQMILLKKIAEPIIMPMNFDKLKGYLRDFLKER